ncbi:MAG TPA: DinB family protein [Acidobacteriaceae bacterium]|nr:DinB family protein [Acidobacteriaceae bacterium]
MRIAPIAVLLAVVLPACAQSTRKDILLKHWKTSGAFTVEVANAMPADGYTFRPVPVEMSFGELMAHIAAADRGACALATGVKPPALPEKIAAWTKDPEKIDVDKDTAVQFLTSTFAFCEQAIPQMPDSRMNTVVGNPARNLTGEEWLWAYFTHTAHHRGQAEVYLRLKGITPPEYEF